MQTRTSDAAWKHHWMILVATVAVASLVLSGCGFLNHATGESSIHEDGSGGSSTQLEQATAQEATADRGTSPQGFVPAAATATADQPVHRIFKAEMDLSIDDMEPAMDAVRRLATAHDGFISEQSFQQPTGSAPPTARIRLRIPNREFDAVLSQLQSMGQVTHLRSWTDDVSDQIVDLEARLRSLKSEENQLRQLMTKAETVEDTLMVRDRLQTIRTETERLEARQRQLKDQTTFSTITVQLKEVAGTGGTVQTRAFKDLGPRLSRAITQNISDLMSRIAAGLVVAAGSLPWLAAAGLAGWAGWSAFQHWQPQRRPVSDPNGTSDTTSGAPAPPEDTPPREADPKDGG